MLCVVHESQSAEKRFERVGGRVVYLVWTPQWVEMQVQEMEGCFGCFGGLDNVGGEVLVYCWR